MTLLDHALHNFGDQVVNQAKKNLRNKGTNNSGKLSRSLKYTVQDGTINFYMEDYGKSIDAGRHGTKKKVSSKSIFKPAKADFPNVTAIKKWVRTKPVKFSGTNKKVSVDSMAFVISRSIKERGIKATMFFSSAFIPKFDKLPDVVANAVASDLVDKLEQDIN